MRKTLSPYKFKRFAAESLRNSLRLLGDSILLYANSSYPSAYQLAVLALEELSKAKSISHYYYSSITNEGFPDENFEQGWLQMIYSHTQKQWAFIARDLFEFSPKLVRFIDAKELDLAKQNATYVGLRRIGKRIDVAGRISTPKAFKEASSKQLITLLVSELRDIYSKIESYGEYFGIEEVDSVINLNDHQYLFTWPHKTHLKSRHFFKQNVLHASRKNAI
jgi:AbiV family abortive infection protein